MEIKTVIEHLIESSYRNPANYLTVGNLCYTSIIKLNNFSVKLALRKTLM